ncbi:MAG: hypothetical protein WBA74_10390 [Cyclobacteriaceae bacterium]
MKSYKKDCLIKKQLPKGKSKLAKKMLKKRLKEYARTKIQAERRK